MSEIEVGEFVRTVEGHIGKVEDLDIDVGIYPNNLIEPITVDEIVKHSKNIIDLIEVGDFVNGSMVYEILEDRRIHIMTGHLLNNEDIKTILTHEQYAKNAYELE